jgi:hypothetical protein
VFPDVPCAYLAWGRSFHERGRPRFVLERTFLVWARSFPAFRIAFQSTEVATSVIKQQIARG